MVIIMLLVSGAVASYTSFIEKQRLVAVAEKIESGFREAQSWAKNGYLGTCDELRYVNFSVFYSATYNDLYYQILLNCAEDAEGHYRTTDAENKSLISLGKNFGVDPTFSEVRFYPLGNLNQTMSFTISSTSGASPATFNIDQGGSIKVTYN